MAVRGYCATLTLLSPSATPSTNESLTLQITTHNIAKVTLADPCKGMNVYRIPEQIGPVDVAVYGSIPLHLRDPFLALQSGLKLTREAVIVSELLRQ